MYYVYILRCEGDMLYTGYTNDVNKRFSAHSDGTGAKFTRSHKPLGLEAIWCTEDKHTALSLEWHMKHISREKKLAIIADDSRLAELLGDELAEGAERIYDLPENLST